MFEISVCMIIKNEEKVLPRILKQVRQFADEIIIVDTGSTDSSKAIAKRYTDKIFDFEWVDDFSKARNYSLSKATKEYVMWLDADDYITKANINKIKALKNSSEKSDVYYFKYTYRRNRKVTMQFYRERLLKRANNYTFEGFVHEVISPYGKVEYKDIEIEHRKLEIPDPKRNIKIYKKHIKLGTEFSARDYYYYARELYYNGWYSSCIKAIRYYLKLNDQYSPNIIGAYGILSDCYKHKNMNQKALDTLLSCIKTYAPTSEICCKIAYHYEVLDNKENAIFWYKSATHCAPQIGGFESPEYANFIPYMELCKLLYKIDFNEAKKYHVLASKINPHHPSVIFNTQFFDRN